MKKNTAMRELQRFQSRNVRFRRRREPPLTINGLQFHSIGSATDFPAARLQVRRHHSRVAAATATAAPRLADHERRFFFGVQGHLQEFQTARSPVGFRAVVSAFVRFTITPAGIPSRFIS